MRIRRARADEGERLREIAVAAKGSWGYEPDHVVAWAAQGDFSPTGLMAKEIYVAEESGRVIGWAALIARGEVGWLDDLWIEPELMRRGIGTRLFGHIAERARAHGASRLEWEAEANAVGFYERLGARPLRDGRVMGVEL